MPSGMRWSRINLTPAAAARLAELRAEQAPTGRVFDESAKPERKERTAIKNWGK